MLAPTNMFAGHCCSHLYWLWSSLNDHSFFHLAWASLVVGSVILLGSFTAVPLQLINDIISSLESLANPHCIH